MSLWARFVLARPWLTLAVTVPMLLLAGLVGLGVFQRLNLAGYSDPGSESAEVDRTIMENFGRQTPDVVVIYSAPPGKTADDIGPAITTQLDRIDRTLLAKPIESYWTSIPPLRTILVSKDKTKALAVLTLAGDEAHRLSIYAKLVPQLRSPIGSTQFAGWNAMTTAYNDQSRQDLLVTESVAIPLTLTLLVIVFGGLVAAAIPLSIGGLAVLGSLGALRLLSMLTDVSAFAVNMASILGLGVAIDYGLLVVTRHREELQRGGCPFGAATRTIQTAGRTVILSAVLLMCGFAGMLVYPVTMLRSLGLGAIIALCLAALVSVTAVPAALALLGHRIDSLSWRRGAVRRAEARAARVWGSLADAVTRRPLATAAIVVAMLALLALPVFGLKLGGVSVTGLPNNDPARIAQEELTAQFPKANSGATMIVQGSNGAPPTSTAVRDIVERVQRVPGVRFARVVAFSRHGTVVQAVFFADDFSQQAERTVAALRRLTAPADTTVLVGGENAVVVDSNTAVGRGLPVMVTVLIGVTIVLMFVAFRSVVLPLKAVAIAGLSLGASFGVLTWIFQNTSRAASIGITSGPLPAPALIMIIAVIFGLSTDYELFLMSRIVEAHQEGASTDEAIRTGMVRTGRVITAAAALLLIVIGAAALSNVNLVKIAAVGMFAAIALDATIVRMLLVPALVELMGEANWWMPGRRHQPRPLVPPLIRSAPPS